MVNFEVLLMSNLHDAPAHAIKFNQYFCCEKNGLRPLEFAVYIRCTAGRPGVYESRIYLTLKKLFERKQYIRILRRPPF